MLFSPSPHQTVEWVPVTGGDLSPSPTPCVSAGFYVALEGILASWGWGAVGSRGTLPNRTRGGGDATWSISHDISMLVPRMARPEVSGTQAPSIDEDKVDGPAAKVQKRQDGCSHAWEHTEPASAQKRRHVFRTRGDVAADGSSAHSADCEADASKCPQGFPLSAGRSRAPVWPGSASGASPAGTRTVSSHSSPCLRTWGQRETEGLHPGPRAGAATPATRVGLAAAVSGGAAPSPSVRFKQTKPSCVAWWHEVTKKHRDVTDLRAGDSDSTACPVDRRPLVRKEGGGLGGDPGGQGRGLSAGRRSPDTAASTRLEHLSDTKCYNPQAARERLPTQRVRVTSVASIPKL